MKTYDSINNFDNILNETMCFDEIFENAELAEQFLNNKLGLIKKLNFKTRVELGKKKNNKIISTYAEKIASIYNNSKDQIKDILQEKILSKNPQFQFRKLEKLDASDLTDLLDDVELLKLIEDLEKDKHE